MLSYLVVVMHMFRIVLLTLCIVTLSDGDLLDGIERIVTKCSNPSVHRLTFCSALELPNGTMQEYIVKLKSLALYIYMPWLQL